MKGGTLRNEQRRADPGTELSIVDSLFRCHSCLYCVMSSRCCLIKVAVEVVQPSIFHTTAESALRSKSKAYGRDWHSYRCRSFELAGDLVMSASGENGMAVDDG